jgi:CRISPR-associated protein Csh2
MSNQQNLVTEKSEILFLYESTFSNPNGDLFTGEQRFDEETKKVLVSDVRIKRFIRDYLYDNGYSIYVANPDPDNKLTGGQRFTMLYDERKDRNLSPREFATTLIDVRMFGAVIPIKNKGGKGKSAKKSDEQDEPKEEKAEAFNITGAVQFALLNPSLHAMDLRPDQGNSILISEEGKKQGSIRTGSVVPYSLNQIHGWVNPFSARHTNLSNDDVHLMFKALWERVNNPPSRSKSGQDCLLLLQIVYNDPNKKIYGVDRLIKLESKKSTEEQIRNFNDYTLNYDDLIKAAQKDFVAEVRFYTENEVVNKDLESQTKFTRIQKL